MPDVLVISGSPSATSKTERVGAELVRRIGESGRTAEQLRLRALPAEPLLGADAKSPEIAAAVQQVAAADGIVLATPVYKAAYSGLLKTFLDLLPQFGFAGKAVLPLATGGSTAHVLALDYGLRPVVHSLGARHVVQSFFLLDQDLTITPEHVEIGGSSAAPLQDVLDQFDKALDGVPHGPARGRTA